MSINLSDPFLSLIQSFISRDKAKTPAFCKSKFRNFRYLIMRFEP